MNSPDQDYITSIITSSSWSLSILPPCSLFLTAPFPSLYAEIRDSKYCIEWHLRTFFASFNIFPCPEHITLPSNVLRIDWNWNNLFLHLQWPIFRSCFGAYLFSYTTGKKWVSPWRNLGLDSLCLRQGFLETLFFLRRKRLDFCNYMVITFSNVYTLAEWEHKTKSTKAQ